MVTPRRRAARFPQGRGADQQGFCAASGRSVLTGDPLTPRKASTSPLPGNFRVFAGEARAQVSSTKRPSARQSAGGSQLVPNSAALPAPDPGRRGSRTRGAQERSTTTPSPAAQPGPLHVRLEAPVLWLRRVNAASVTTRSFRHITTTRSFARMERLWPSGAELPVLAASSAAVSDRRRHGPPAAHWALPEVTGDFG